MARFFRRGKTRFWFLPTIASGTKAPTTAEITAGTELTSTINDVAGFSFNNSRIETPDLATTFNSTIAGPDTVDDSSLTFYLDSTTNTLRTTLAKGVLGYVWIMDNKTGSPVTGDKGDTWPIEVGGIPKQYSLGEDPALWIANFAMTATPALDIAIL